jgi:hypothetical protein
MSLFIPRYFLALSGVTAGAASSFILLCSTAIAQVQIPGLYATGVDGGGSTLPLSSFDPHYIVMENLGASAVSLLNPPDVYVLGSSPTSAWIWQNSNGQPSLVTRTFRTSFDLAGLDPLSARIDGNFAVDDQLLDILLNGVSTGITATVGYLDLKPFTLSSGFVGGVNDLDFIARDINIQGGFLVSSLQGTARPLKTPTSSVPGPLPLLGVAATFGLSRKLRKRIKTSKAPGVTSG